MKISFEDLPRRIFLDSCTVQTLRNYGNFINEDEPISPTDRIHKVPGGIENIEALRNIFLVSQRALFEWIVSQGSFEEARDKRDAGNLQWLYDIADHSEICLEGDGPNAESEALGMRLLEPKFGYLSIKDRRLLQEAVILRCEAFLTVERRLPQNSEHIRRELSIRILTPIVYWEMLKPWAALWL